MYKDLVEAWRNELESTELMRLAPDFYVCVADYVRRLGEEGRMLDKRTIKARLLRRKAHNAKRMLRELVQTRYKKLIRRVANNDRIPSDLLAKEEAEVCAACQPLLESYQGFAESLLRGKLSNLGFVAERKSIPLRFLGDVPEVIGADMRNYGPFRAEDVASVPTQNAQILVKQRLAAKVEIT